MTPGGKVSVTFTFVAAAGPLLVTVRRYAKFTPTCPGFGDADLLKARSILDGLITFSVTVPECTVAPVPVTLKLKSPSGVAAVVSTVSVALFDVASVILMEVGVKLPLAPAGNPLALRLMTPVKPANGAMVTVYCALPPGVTKREAGVAVIVKSGVVEAGAEATNVE